MIHSKPSLPVILPGCLAAMLVNGCSGPQSTLDPAGESAQKIAQLFWTMTAGAAIVWTVVVGLAVYAIKFNRGTHDVHQAGRYIIGGGVVAPTVVLTGLLIWGLALLPGLVAPAPADSLKIRVRGAQWWWRVHYQMPDIGGNVFEVRVADRQRSGRDSGIPESAAGSKPRDDAGPVAAPSAAEPGTRFFGLANEIRLPVNQPVQFYLESEDVIHSFWIPALGGKVDMIPGRQTRLTLVPTRTGVFRGACAEYCGTAHTWMNFYVIVMEQDDFSRWYRAQALPASEPLTPESTRGAELFLSSGCSACHTVRGTQADGTLGPDLTHVGSRVSLAAGVFTGGNPGQPSVDARDFSEWIADPARFKESVHMPRFGMLPDEDLRSLSVYLQSLK